MTTSPLFLGIDVGGTNIKVGLTDDVGNVLSSAKVDTDTSESLDAGLTNMQSGIRDALAQAGTTLDQVKAIGLACPGPMDLKAGRLL